jgi:hypothetical protein
MAITFKSVGHFFATVYKDVVSELPKVEATKATVETVTESVPGGSAVVPLEDLGYAVLGELSAILNAGGDAAKAKLADAGMDVTVVNDVEALLKSVPQIATLAKKL